MLTITQSNDIRHLAKRLNQRYQSDERSIFEPFVVITPAKVLSDWLEKYIAKETGISTMISAQFWGQYQWQLMKTVLDFANDFVNDDNKQSVPDVAMLSQAVLRWKMFGFLLQYETNDDKSNIPNPKQRPALQRFEAILEDDAHPLYVLLTSLVQDGVVTYQKLWQLCIELSQVYVKYLTLRPHWLGIWADDGSVDVASMIAQKDKIDNFYHHYANQYQDDSDEQDSTDNELKTPDFLVAYYTKLERALAFLWQQLFAKEYKQRQELEQRFWKILDGKGEFAAIKDKARQKLPKKMYLFTVQQIPKVEIEFLKHLSCYHDIELLHLNPSAQFWADTVDKKWLMHQKIINENSVYLKDYGHGLLSRLGKESRQTFAMLADISGGVHDNDDQVIWRDEFVMMDESPTLLNQLKQDILDLDESGLTTTIKKQVTQSLLDNLHQKQHDSTTHWHMLSHDDSLSIHSCHSLKRQLEIARQMMVRWLNQPSADGTPRQLSDIAVLLPDMNAASDMVRSVFVDGRGLDGFYLPAKMTGVADKSVASLWQAILGFCRLPSTRFYKDAVCDFLMLPEIYQSFGLTFEQMLRGCELLELAGFRRGLDAYHLKQELDAGDEDYRFSFAFALDRLVAGLLLKDVNSTSMLYPFAWHADSHAISEQTKPLAGVSLNDTAIIQALCHIYTAFTECVMLLGLQQSVESHLINIEKSLIKRYFAHYQGTVQMLSIYSIINGLKRLASNYGDKNQQPNMPLEFVMASIDELIAAQQVGSEPAGVITFGRFGSLRGIPFKLVIMLDMNLASFPRADYHNRLDLMKAGMRERGDRLNEEDDNGAFLEALLCATESCWIFYTGQSPSAELLPATPVSELIDFLSHEPNWRLDAQDETTAVLDDNLTQLIKNHLITKHSILPFEDSVFEMPAASDDNWLLALSNRHKLNQQKKLPPPPLWQQVYDGIKTGNQPSKPLVHWMNGEQMAVLSQDLSKGNIKQEWQDSVPRVMSLSQMISDIANPVQAFFRDKMTTFRTTEQENAEEPLMLNGLDDWALTNHLLKLDIGKGEPKPTERDDVLYGDSVPAGVARLTIISQKQQQIDELKQLATHNLSTLATRLGGDVTPLLSPLHHPVTLNKVAFLDGAIELLLPDASVCQWRQLSVSKLRPKQLIMAWLSHVCWCMTKQGDELADGFSAWQFRLGGDDLPNAYNGMIAFRTMSQELANAEFHKWRNYWALIKNTPVALTAESAVAYLAHQGEADLDWAKVFKSWLEPSYHHSPFETNSHHDDWQLLLGDNDPKQALQDATQLAWVYQTMHEYSIKIDG